MEFLYLFFLEELFLRYAYNHCLMVINEIGWKVNNVLFSRVAESKETLVTPRSRGDSGKPLVDSRASACRYSCPGAFSIRCRPGYHINSGKELLNDV